MIGGGSTASRPDESCMAHAMSRQCASVRPLPACFGGQASSAHDIRSRHSAIDYIFLAEGRSWSQGSVIFACRDFRDFCLSSCGLRTLGSWAPGSWPIPNLGIRPSRSKTQHVPFREEVVGKATRADPLRINSHIPSFFRQTHVLSSRWAFPRPSGTSWGPPAAQSTHRSTPPPRKPASPDAAASSPGRPKTSESSRYYPSPPAHSSSSPSSLPSGEYPVRHAPRHIT